ncbi:hypothetical protein PUNSTDRAFT_129350 [Punctularia strigosozonata HHB-11173 SS5]|uniref:uncharacterized protein n=1 Tax=Punctularia strigosozonata (strain HHB-11173) TaxID=741275 RepID=UPI0004416A45|nr:uncharacterized protein PUNSTDRAFT_129350 [Punctularia strigosozonata HHB-11173 SS5]EIN13677.1 hypothetical protein PUNSTDRAFT_129350 [Punctularia strigosozonata HHB-11173 SS5]
MDKVMLTLIKANEHAAAFYSALGFVEDPTSPGFVVEDPDDSWEDEDLDEVDYMILSKRIE